MNSSGLKKCDILDGPLKKSIHAVTPATALTVVGAADIIAGNRRLRDTKRRNDVEQYSSAHLHSVFFNTRVCQAPMCPHAQNSYSGLLPAAA
mmetsp:Transcript_18284/g.31822  ORF Transcript_18284/g.31822 Transcript_18284/m.31822 type:complete len:92 (+) Transcript_18284:234-509(+)